MVFNNCLMCNILSNVDVLKDWGRYDGSKGYLNEPTPRVCPDCGRDRSIPWDQWRRMQEEKERKKASPYDSGTRIGYSTETHAGRQEVG